MAITLADIERLEVETIRDAATALTNEATSMDDTKAGFKKLPIQGHWTGVSATAAFGNLDSLTKFMTIHAEDYRSSAKGMLSAATEFDGVQQALKTLTAFAEDHGFWLDKTTGTVTPVNEHYDPNDLDHVVSTAKQILVDANTADADLTRAVGLIGGPAGDAGAGGLGWNLDQAQKDMTPEAFNRWWNSLTEEQKQEAYNRDHSIGNRPGMPFEDRTRFNERHLAELTQAAQAEVTRLREAHPDWANGAVPPNRAANWEYRHWKEQWEAANHTVAGYQQVSQAMQAPDGMRRYLGYIDDKGHAAVSINNPDNAKRIATYVPGTGQDLARLQYSTEKSLDMLGATLDADRSLSATDVSVTTWMGYDRPMNIIPEAANPGYARGGAQALDDFQAGLRASHNDATAGGRAIQTVIGHSYGSTLVGAAATGGHHLDADNIITLGSPGVLADHASDLNVNRGAHVFASRAQNDVITLVTGATLGPDPTGSGFGAIVFEAAPGPEGPVGMP